MYSWEDLWYSYIKTIRRRLLYNWYKKQNWPPSRHSGALWRREGKRKESLQLRLWNLNSCIKKVDAKCWLAEMTLVMTSLPLTRVFQCLFTSALVPACWLVEIWQLSRRWATRELEVEFKFQRHSRTLSLLSRAVARAPRRACSQAKVNRKTQIILPEYCSFPISAYMTVNRSNVRFVIGCASP